MKTMTVGEFKAHFSDALDAVRDGETIIVAYGRNRTKVAAMVPYAALNPAKKRTLGLLKGKVRLRFARTFSISDEDFLTA